MVDRHRHAPSTRRLAITAADRPRAPIGVYRGRSAKTYRGIYDPDHVESHPGGRFRWLISTFLAGAVGAIAIFVVIYGSADRSEQAGGLLPSLKRMREASSEPPAPRTPQNDGGLKWSAPKSDRLQIASGAMSTRSVIHESLKMKRKDREYIRAKPYVRIVSRLAAVPASYSDVIPTFNPYKLYGNTQVAASTEEDTAGRGDVSIKVVELLGGILPGEDGQELDNQEVTDLVERAQDGDGGQQGARADGSETLDQSAMAATQRRASEEPLPPNTTVLTKAQSDSDDPVEETEKREVRVFKAARGDTLSKLLQRAGAENWQARAMVEAGHGVFPDSALAVGQEVHITLVPSLTEQNRFEPSRFSVFGEGHEHKVTVFRNPAGEFAASAAPVEEREAMRAAASGGDSTGENQPTSLYASVYAAGLVQNVPPETIMQILRVHASDTDFRRRVRADDMVELFFDAKEEGASDGPPGELLYTSIRAGGDSSHFYRYRTPDGIVDYYDSQGNNSKKFLTRKPVRGDEVRLVSGFGMRRHPILNVLRPHLGIDWAGPIGTPILAAGNGVIEEAGRKGDYGNFVRIRHANGYTTQYAHMSRFGPGIVPGAKVRQNQVIGAIGTTGLSTGAHLHFEVLINSRFVDPLSIQVPREKQLTGRQLADFQKEKARIDELMRRAPVLTQSK